jgi:DNA-directed RNA polymerase subunit RPC12/RpoP
MTAKEAIETLRANYPDACFEQLREAVDAAIEALKDAQPETHEEHTGTHACDCISRQAVFDLIEEMYYPEEECCGSDWRDGSNDTLDRISCKLTSLPSVQPERKIGHWIDEGQYADYHSQHVYRCSECGDHIIEDNTDDYRFCRYCGIRMTNKREQIDEEMRQHDLFDWLVEMDYDLEAVAMFPSMYLSEVPLEKK